MSTVTIQSVTKKDGQVTVQFVGSKKMITFQDVQTMKDAVLAARDADRRQQLLLALGAIFDADPTMASAAGMVVTYYG